MMGQSISDPENTEGGGQIRGMGLLPTETIFRAEKTTVQAQGELLDIEGDLAMLSGAKTTGYEIHMGETAFLEGAKPLQKLMREGQPVLDGCQHQNAYGSYLHGIFDSQQVLEWLAQALAAKKGIALHTEAFDMQRYKEMQYDKLADMVRSALDMNYIYQVLEGQA